MRPLVIGGHVWGVDRVSPGNPFLMDRTGTRRIATTDPVSKVIRISDAVMPPLYDKVLLHEAAHAAMVESGLTDLLTAATEDRGQVFMEELLAWFMEEHGIKIIQAVINSLGRPICINDTCIGG